MEPKGLLFSALPFLVLSLHLYHNLSLSHSRSLCAPLFPHFSVHSFPQLSFIKVEDPDPPHLNNCILIPIRDNITHIIRIQQLHGCVAGIL